MVARGNGHVQVGAGVRACERAQPGCVLVPHGQVDGAQGIAEIIVDTDLEKTKAVNDVAAVVFDYRGYDTIGESFILLAAICGSFVIIRMIRKNDAEGGERREV